MRSLNRLKIDVSILYYHKYLISTYTIVTLRFHTINRIIYKYVLTLISFYYRYIINIVLKLIYNKL